LLPTGQVLIAGGMGFPSYAEQAELYDPAQGSAGAFRSIGKLVATRELHTATLLPDGRVLIANGVAFSDAAGAEIYDPSAGPDGTFSQTSDPAFQGSGLKATLLPNGRVLLSGDPFDAAVQLFDAHDPSPQVFTAPAVSGNLVFDLTATLLPDGTVLVAGGDTQASVPVDQALVYDPRARGFLPNAQMKAGRYSHTATLLANGEVLIAGGIGLTGGIPSLQITLPSAELYDPAAHAFTLTGSMSVARAQHASTLLPDGRVLITGGSNDVSTELYDPATGAFTPGPNLVQARYGHTATLLPDGGVLIAGGATDTTGSVVVSAMELCEAPQAAGISTSVGSLPREWHTATLLPTGKVLIAGGYDGQNVLASALLYDPQTRTLASTGSMSGPRANHRAILLPSGEVLVAGGSDGNGAVATAELYDPWSGTFTPTGSMKNPRTLFAAALLPTGEALVVGGYDFFFSSPPLLELYR
jgi:WD40 repeat protein